VACHASEDRGCGARGIELARADSVEEPSRGPSANTPLISRTIVSVRGWSALLTTITSGISVESAGQPA
jgi:hypothetical protein